MNATLSRRARSRLSIAITGHRWANASYSAHAPAVRRALEQMFRRLDAECGDVWRQQGGSGRVELYSLLANGVDQDAADAARILGWPVIAPLPFGRRLNAALYAEPSSEAEARRLLGGLVPHADLALERVTRLEQQMAGAEVIEAPEADQIIVDAWLHTLARAADQAFIRAFDALLAERYARAAEVMIDRADVLVAVWDGRGADAVGGTGHCLRVALERGLPALWIDPARAPAWRLIRAWEDIARVGLAERPDQEPLGALVRTLLVTAG